MTRLPGKYPREGAGDSPAARRAHWSSNGEMERMAGISSLASGCGSPHA